MSAPKPPKEPMFKMEIGSYDPARETASRDFSTRECPTLELCVKCYNDICEWQQRLGRVCYFPPNVTRPDGSKVPATEITKFWKLR